jgi:protein associated with RNAse G/E
VHEVKRTLTGETREYHVEPLLIESGTRAVVAYRLEEGEDVSDGRLTLPRRAVSLGYFWQVRPYNVYHWLHAGSTLAYYINIGRVREIASEAVVWDDYAVDILVHPDGAVHVVDEHEVPRDADDAVRRFIADATEDVVRHAAAITGAVAAETSTLLAGNRTSLGAEQSERAC